MILNDKNQKNNQSIFEIEVSKLVLNFLYFKKLFYTAIGFSSFSRLLIQKNFLERKETQRSDDKLFNQSKSFAAKFPIYYKKSTKRIDNGSI